VQFIRCKVVMESSVSLIQPTEVGGSWWAVCLGLVVLTIAALCAGYAWGVYRRLWLQSTRSNRDAFRALYAADAAIDVLDDFVDVPVNVVRRKPARFIASAINMAREEFGLVSKCEANRLMVRKFLRDKMRERKMRPTHIALHLDSAVTLYFTPLERDIANQLWENSDAVVARHRAVFTAQLPFWGQFVHALWWGRIDPGRPAAG
jgi:hypothetical protein